MKVLKTIFIDYAPIFLFFPFSLAVGLYAWREMDILFLEKNRPFFYFYVIFAIAPLYFIIFRSRQDLGHEVLEIAGKFMERFSKNKWGYVAIGIVFSVFYLYIASIHISTYYERDRWILENDLPILPIDMVLPQRLALVSSWIFPLDIAIPLVNLLFILLWLAFLIYVSEGSGNSWTVVFLVFISTFLTGTLYTAQYATFELSAALLGFIGMYGIWRGKWSTGLSFLVIGSVFKNTGVFILATGTILFCLALIKERSIRRIFEKTDLALLAFLGVFFVANHWGSFYYMTVFREGPGYLISPSPGRIFWLSSFLTFLEVLINNYTFLSLFGLLGSLVLRRYWLFAFVSIGVLMVLRSFSIWADDGYSMIFIPSLSFFSVLGVQYLWGILRQKWVRNFCLTAMVIFNASALVALLGRFPGGMHRLNSNFDLFVEKISVEFPEDGWIYQRDISIKPYLSNLRGGDLDAIRFRIYPDEKEKFIIELSQPGCKLILAERRHLQIVGVSEMDMASMGYSESPYELVDQSGTWVAYSRDCNAWEYQ